MGDKQDAAGLAWAGFDRRACVTLAAAILTIALVGMGLSLTFPLLSLRMAEAGHSNRFIGLNTAMNGLATVVGAGFIPLIARAVGASTMVLASLALGALCLIAFEYTPIWSWFGLRLVFGAVLTVLFVLSEFWINTAAPESRRGLVMGIYATVLSLGLAAGPAILGLTGTQGVAPFATGAALFVLAALPVWLVAGQAPMIEGKTRIGILGFVKAAPAATLAALVYGTVETGAFALLPVYGTRIGLPADRAALLISAVALGNVLLQIPLGLLSDRLDRRRLLLACALVGLAGALALPWASGSQMLLLILLVVWGGCVAGLYTIGLAQLGARFQGAELATASAAFVLLFNVGSLVGPPFIGEGMDLFNPHGLAWSLAVIFALYIMVFMRRA